MTTVLAVSEGPLSEAELIEAPASLQQIVSMVTSPRVSSAELIENALKFSAPKAVEVTSTRQTAENVKILVADRGPGIDPQFLSRAFDPFTQEDASMTRTADGLGVGLFVARRLAEYLGITLELRDRAGGGAEATLTLHTPVERNVIEPLVERRLPPSGTRPALAASGAHHL